MTDRRAAALSDAYEACRRITASRARSFYLGLRLAPEPQRSALYALYAWNRLGDDIVDDASTSAETRASRFDDFAKSTQAVQGHPENASGDLWIALADVLACFPINPSWLDAMLSGLRRDLSHVQPETLDELYCYCDEVAGSVGRCCVAIWGLQEGADAAAAYHLADRLGRAFQLTNILRDVGEDSMLAPRRCYIPSSCLDAHGITMNELLAWRDPRACRKLILELAAEARQSFAAGEELLTCLRPRFRPTLWAMHRIYERTLGLIEHDPQRSIRQSHVRPSRAVALSIACRAFAMSALASGRR